MRRRAGGRCMPPVMTAGPPHRGRPTRRIGVGRRVVHRCRDGVGDRVTHGGRPLGCPLPGMPADDGDGARGVQDHWSPTDPRRNVLTASPCPRFPTTSRSAPRDCSRRTGAVLPDRRPHPVQVPPAAPSVRRRPRRSSSTSVPAARPGSRRSRASTTDAPLSDPVLDRREDPYGPQYRTSACRVLQREPQCRGDPRSRPRRRPPLPAR